MINVDDYVTYTSREDGLPHEGKVIGIADPDTFAVNISVDGAVFASVPYDKDGAEGTWKHTGGNIYTPKPAEDYLKSLPQFPVSERSDEPSPPSIDTDE